MFLNKLRYVGMYYISNVTKIVVFGSKLTETVGV